MKITFLSLLMIVLLNCQSKDAAKNDKVPKAIQQTKTFPKLEKDRYNVAFLIMDGTFNTELTAPFDIFQHTIFRKGIKSMGPSGEDSDSTSQLLA